MEEQHMQNTDSVALGMVWMTLLAMKAHMGIPQSKNSVWGTPLLVGVMGVGELATCQRNVQYTLVGDNITELVAPLYYRIRPGGMATFRPHPVQHYCQTDNASSTTLVTVPPHGPCSLANPPQS